MTDWTRRTIRALDAQHSGATWDVVPALYTPKSSLCREYKSAGAAHSALVAASYAPTGAPVACPPMDDWDLKSLVKYARGDEQLILARRMGVGS